MKIPRRDVPHLFLHHCPQRIRILLYQKAFRLRAFRWRVTAQQVLDAYQEIVMSDLDPAPVTDTPRFVFTRPASVGPCYFSHAAVPQDCDNVDLFEADYYAQQDNAAATALLNEKHPSTDMLWASIGNTYRWARFWAVRHWDPDERTAAAAMARSAEAIMDRLADKADAVMARRREAEGYDVDVPWTEPGLLGTGGTPEGIALRRQRIARQRRQQIKSVTLPKKGTAS
jgi:hypothetical protein